MITFKRIGELITESDINDFELFIGLTLPDDYKEHMIKYNGGKPVPRRNIYFGDYDDGVGLSRFQSIKHGVDTIDNSHEKSKRYLPENYMNIGYTLTGNLCMSLDEKSYGHIYVYYSDVELEFLASSFTEFIEGLNIVDLEENY